MVDSTITDIIARPIFDGCARPSLEVVVTTRAARVKAAPSFSDPRSSGKYEITHFPRGGVQGSIELINSSLRDLLVGRDAADQRDIDDFLLGFDGTGNFDLLGGNTAEVTSMAIAKVAAASVGRPLYEYIAGGQVKGVPHLMPNIIGGGATMGDEGWKGRTPDIQDHIVLPIGCGSFGEELAAVADVFHRTGQLLQEVDPTYTGGRDEEYCWLPGIGDLAALEVLQQACNDITGKRGIRFRLGLDVGAADLWDEAGKYYVYRKEDIKRTAEQHARHLADLTERFDLFYLEDSFFEDHVELYVEQTQQFGSNVMIAGDDLLAGDLTRLEKMAECGAINTAVIKLNMAGTVTRSGDFVHSCQQQSFTTIGSCRTYDSPDDTLADLVVGWGCNTYKCGSPAGGEHAAKQNRYMRIDEDLGKQACFVPWPSIQP